MPTHCTASRWICRILLLALWFALTLGQAHAGSLVMSIDNVTGPSAGQGTFDVLLTNTNPAGGTSYDVASFSFELSVPASSGVQFTGASTAFVSPAYIFAGTGGASIDPTFTLSLDSFPNTQFSGSDTEFTYPSIAVGPGAVFGLGLISYSVSPQAPAGDVPISFVLARSSVSDPSGAAIADFQTDSTNGIIHLGVSTIPEPSSFLLATIGIAGVFLAGLCKRLQRAARRITGAEGDIHLS